MPQRPPSCGPQSSSTPRLARCIILAAALAAATSPPAGAATLDDAAGDEGGVAAQAVAARVEGLSIAPFSGVGVELPSAAAQPSPAAAPKAARELYVSWGYNADRFARSDLRIAQPSLGNDFVLHSVRSHDQKGWTDLFNNSMFTSQYSARVGYFFNTKQDLAIEVNFEHVRFVVTQDQSVRLTGTLSGEGVDKTVALTEDFLRYKLNNGANFLLVNLVKRLPLVGEPAQTGSVSALLKAGAGIGVPHPTNFVFDQANTPGFQFGGLDVGLEGALRVHFFRWLYVEFAQKALFARYTGLEIHEGRAAHHIWTYLTALSLGTSVHLPARRQP